MFKKSLFMFSLLLLLIPASMAEGHEKPIIAMLRFGPLPLVSLAEKGAIDMLEVYGFINAEERDILYQRQELDGENVTVIWGDAGFRFADVNLILESMFDRGADVLITSTTPVTQAAVNITLNMDEPPIVLFNVVSNPYYAGIASTPCIKPKHVTGSQALTPYERIVPLLLLQDPDMKTVGTMFNLNEANAVFGADAITAVGESLGLTVERTAITSAADLTFATEGLVNKGVEAIILPTEGTMTQGLPAIVAVANEYGIPVFYSAANRVFRGATVGAGFHSYYQEGVIAGRMLVAYLNDDINIATTGINLQSNLAVGINLDSAAAQDVEIAEALMDLADFVVKDGKSANMTPELPEVDPYLPAMEWEDRQAADAAFLESLACTPERIAEQAARLSSP